MAASPLRAFALAPAVIVSERQRIKIPYGVQVGDLSGDRAILWAKADRDARMLVEWATTESMKDARIVTGPVVGENTDFCGKLDLSGLPAGQRIFCRVRFLDLGDMKTLSEPVLGSFATPPVGRRSVRILWSGDTAGQGWGINPEFGGMRIYETMRRLEPDLFIHSGDTVYADNPISAEVALADGTVWKNLVIEEKSKVAETLREFRMNYAYNLMDENLRRFNAAVPMLAQWDDHEVTNNWYWEKRLDRDQRYEEGSVAVSAARAMKAFHDYMPTRRHPLEQDRIYESFRYGPSLEIFRIDFRSYRDPNTDGLQTRIARDMPSGLIVRDNFRERRGSEAVARGDHGTAEGRELDRTFEPEAVFGKTPPQDQANLPPSAGLEFFGRIDLDGASEASTRASAGSGGAGPVREAPVAAGLNGRRSTVEPVATGEACAIAPPRSFSCGRAPRAGADSRGRGGPLRSRPAGAARPGRSAPGCGVPGARRRHAPARR